MVEVLRMDTDGSIPVVSCPRVRPITRSYQEHELVAYSDLTHGEDQVKREFSLPESEVLPESDLASDDDAVTLLELPCFLGQ